ncbi:hypothetical protein PVK06_039877 [Gossypium arboreum]|uniref:Uncharacterized protein n=1 Tax=Gossypium arboreum TaxID=29729 RepID=A0ABR0N419_GOSAR|nr:hypothetical protein PVK06_039877 [Gossypium arboreum]
MEIELADLHISKEEEDEIPIVGPSSSHKSLYDFYFVGCFAIASVIHFLPMRNTLANLCHPLGGLFLEAITRQLGNFVGLFEYYNANQITTGFVPYLQVWVDIHSPLKRRKKIQLSPGSSDFYLIQLVKDISEADMGWDLSLWVMSRQAVVGDNIWLRLLSTGASTRSVPMLHDSEDDPLSGFDWKKRLRVVHSSFLVSNRLDSARFNDNVLQLVD